MVSRRKSKGKSKKFPPCPEGKERNPDTNRCRKITGKSSRKKKSAKKASRKKKSAKKASRKKKSAKKASRKKKSAKKASRKKAPWWRQSVPVRHLDAHDIKRARYLLTMGLDFDATDKEIAQQYRHLARIYHPDRGGNKASFQQLQEAYDFLMKKDVNMAASSIST